jgi:TolA-binding protein
MPWLQRLYEAAPDFQRRNWSATLLTTAFLKERKIDRVYRMVPLLLSPSSFAGRSALLNMAALEAADDLFADEKYRDALWIYRLVHSRDALRNRCQIHLDNLQSRSDAMRKSGVTDPRALMRIQEEIGEVEAEIKALDGIANYDVDLAFRIARSYREIFRYREACELFVFLHECAQGRQAEEALYLAFDCATHFQPWERAIALGLDHMKQYPAGEFYDSVSIVVGQIYAKMENWAEVIKVMTEALQVSPNHAEAAECMFMAGYASFMEENFTNAVSWLGKANEKYPGNQREADCTYWRGMALMFDNQFKEAAVDFDTVARLFSECIYVQDAAFRRAVCDYGLGNMKEADGRLEAFIARYPQSPLVAEGYMMLGDIAASFGELPKAVRNFQQVMEREINIEYYNYAAFRCGEILAELQKFDLVIDHFREYMRQNRDGCNIPQAMYWIGSSLWSMGEKKGALDFYLKSIAQYGADRKALGIDQILEDWVVRTRGAEGNASKQAWMDLNALMKKAVAAKQPALAIRLKRIALYEPGISEARKSALTKELLDENVIANASGGVLEWMLDQAQAQGNRDLMSKVAQATIRDFTETDYALSARMVLAQDAIRQEDFATALRHLKVIKEVYASSGEAAEALMMMGSVYLKRLKFAEADDCYKSVLAVREWRGPLWPAALYGRGECSRQQGKLDQAAAYYERIYLMYLNYADWAAKAYVARVDCLMRLQQPRKAVEVLRDMLSKEEMEKRPEAVEARERLASLERGI